MSRVIKFFLIDDEEDDRDIFHYALKSVPRTVDFAYAAGGCEALKQLEKNDTLPDYIFVDLNMPGMNGIDCLQAIKKIAALEHIPVIVYSGIGDDKLEKRARDLKAAHYLIKPFTTHELSEVLSDLLSGKPLPFLLPATVKV